MCERLLANPLIESYEIEVGRMSEVAPRIAVLVFPGSNDDRDAAWALTALGADARSSGTRKRSSPRWTRSFFPGGFSYGDYLRCGAIARFSPAMQAVTAFAAEGGLVLGICNGFQILCEAGLLPGVLRPNASLSFVCGTCRARRAQRTRRSPPGAAGQRLVIPVKHGEGCYHADRTWSDEQIVSATHGREPERLRRRHRRRRERDGTSSG